MSTPRQGLPTFWSTHIAKVLVGDQPCLLAPWLSGHFTLEKRRRDQTSLVKWKADHTALLEKTTAQFRADGWKCSVESFFKVVGQTAILSGKADLILQAPDRRPRIADTKSGTPRESDLAQVMIEMVAIPLAWNSPSMIFEGEVVYPDHTVRITPAQAEEMKPRIFAVLRQLGKTDRPVASPSESTCRFCDVPDELCGDRWTDANAPAPIRTELF